MKFKFGYITAEEWALISNTEFKCRLCDTDKISDGRAVYAATDPYESWTPRFVVCDLCFVDASESPDEMYYE